MTGTESNILHRKVQSDEGSRTPCTPSRHSDGSQSLSMPINLVGHSGQQKSRKAAFTMAEVLITLGIIGIIAAITLPSLIGKYQKNVAINRLKKVYTMLSQAVQFSVNDNEDIKYWDFDNLNAKQFMDRYLVPYFQNVALEEPLVQGEGANTQSYSNVYAFADGTTLYGWLWHNPQVNGLLQIVVDINGKAKPNIYGRDKFIFYIFSQKADWYNTGAGNVAQKIPEAGLYPDGYGYDRERMKNDSWRGCNRRGDEESLGNQAQAGAYCTALIMLDGWKIADDYKW